MKIKDNKIDSLFHDRLDGYEIEPSAGASEMIDRLIKGRHNRRIYVRMAVAAGIMLIVASGIVLSAYLNNYRQESMGRTIILSDNDLAVQPGNENMANVEKPVTRSSTVKAMTDNQAEKNIASLTVSKKTINKPKVEASQAGINEDIRPEIVKTLDTKFRVAALNENINNLIPATPEKKKTATTEKKSPVVIEYIADKGPVKSGKPQLVEGIVNKAKELGKDVNLGDIRDLKDQLFALDFIKPRKQNSR